MPAFKIVRIPDKEPMALLCNNVLVYYVGTCPETGCSFYCSMFHNYGVRVCDKTGEKTIVNPNMRGGNGKQKYMNFANAFGHHIHILIHQAVWMAVGRTVPEGWELDHVNGDKRDNTLPNLRTVTRQQNCRDGGFLTKLRNRKIDPVRIQRPYLLRYFDRMAIIKTALSPRKYYTLSRNDLQTVLYDNPGSLSTYFTTFFNVQIYFRQ